jgi:hypothetical protein
VWGPQALEAGGEREKLALTAGLLGITGVGDPVPAVALGPPLQVWMGT